MIASINKTAAIGLTAIGFAILVAGSAQADVVLPVSNLQFNVLGGSFGAGHQKDFFSTVAPTGWSTGTAGVGGALTYVGQQGSEGLSYSNTGNIYGVYTTPGFSVTVPAGTNFFQADGNPQYEDTIFQKITGLTAGVTYDLQFQQAAGQQTGFTGDTTEQWKVFLGVGGIGTNCSGSPCTVTGTTNNIEDDSTLMSTPSGTDHDWNSVSMTFTPTASDFLSDGSIILTFLAWGDGGSTVNQPPTVFLEGVNTPPQVPEPATLSLFGAGALGLGFMRRRAKRKTQA